MTMRKDNVTEEYVKFENEDGILKDYDPDLVRIDEEESLREDLSGYVYENKEGDSRQYLPQTLSEKSPVIAI
ncbi:MAG: hypothetical protein Q4A65_00155 [Bacillota bacterium]|nr:hypothetical protein [Bacillota bacterium]